MITKVYDISNRDLRRAILDYLDILDATNPDLIYGYYVDGISITLSSTKNIQFAILDQLNKLSALKDISLTY